MLHKTDAEITRESMGHVFVRLSQSTSFICTWACAQMLKPVGRFHSTAILSDICVEDCLIWGMLNKTAPAICLFTRRHAMIGKSAKLQNKYIYILGCTYIYVYSTSIY